MLEGGRQDVEGVGAEIERVEVIHYNFEFNTEDKLLILRVLQDEAAEELESKLLDSDKVLTIKVPTFGTRLRIGLFNFQSSQHH